MKAQAYRFATAISGSQWPIDLVRVIVTDIDDSDILSAALELAEEKSLELCGDDEVRFVPSEGNAPEIPPAVRVLEDGIVEVTWFVR